MGAGAGVACGECYQRNSTQSSLGNNKKKSVSLETVFDGFVEKVLHYSSQHSELEMIKPLLLDDEYMSLYFYKYLKTSDSSTAAERHLSFFRDVEKLLGLRSAKTFTKLALQLQSSYLLNNSNREIALSSSSKMKIEDALMELKNAAIESVELKDRLVLALKVAQHESLVLLIRKMWPGFMKNHEYLRWREESHRANKSSMELKWELAVLVEQSYITSSVAQLQSIVASGKRSLNHVFTSRSWLASFIGTMQHLPVSLTLSSAKKEEHGFPLIHVNRCFEQSTGYSQDEVMGKNCRFLQSQSQSQSQQQEGPGQQSSSSMSKATDTGTDTDDDINKNNNKVMADEMERVENIKSSSAAISTALHAARPVQVFIPNFRKDGTTFLNLVSLKPIFHAKTREYLYVVGLQFDASKVESRTILQDLATELMSLLPDTVDIGSDSCSGSGRTSSDDGGVDEKEKEK